MMSIVFLYSIFFVAFIGLPVANAENVTNIVIHVVPIKHTKNTTVTIDTNSTFPGKNYNITIYKPEPLPYGAQLKLCYIPAKDNPIIYQNLTKEWVAWSDSGTWNSTTTSLTISTYFNEWKHGLYKVVVLANGIVIGVSKPLQVKRPTIQIPLSKRTYSQWESILITATLPYPTLKNNSLYSFEIMLKSQPDSYYSTGKISQERFQYPKRFGYEVKPNSTLVTFPPGLYNIRIVVLTQVYDSSYDNMPYKVDYVTSLHNTTFSVIKNDAQISIANNQTNFKYGDIVNYSFTTINKVQLTGPIQIWQVPSYTLVEILQQDSASFGNTTINSNILYGTYTIALYNVGCPPSYADCRWFRPYGIHLATFETTYINLFNDADSPFLTIDVTSRPKDICILPKDNSYCEDYD